MNDLDLESLLTTVLNSQAATLHERSATRASRVIDDGIIVYDTEEERVSALPPVDRRPRRHWLAAAAVLAALGVGALALIEVAGPDGSVDAPDVADSPDTAPAGMPHLVLPDDWVLTSVFDDSQLTPGQRLKGRWEHGWDVPGSETTYRHQVFRSDAHTGSAVADLVVAVEVRVSPVTGDPVGDDTIDVGGFVGTINETASGGSLVYLEGDEAAMMLVAPRWSAAELRERAGSFRLRSPSGEDGLDPASVGLAIVDETAGTFGSDDPAAPTNRWSAIWEQGDQTVGVAAFGGASGPTEALLAALASTCRSFDARSGDQGLMSCEHDAAEGYVVLDSGPDGSGPDGSGGPSARLVAWTPEGSDALIVLETTDEVDLADLVGQLAPVDPGEWAGIVAPVLITAADS